MVHVHQMSGSLWFPTPQGDWASGQGCWGPRPLTRDPQVEGVHAVCTLAPPCWAVRSSGVQSWGPLHITTRPSPEADGWLGGACRESEGHLELKMRQCDTQEGAAGR